MPDNGILGGLTRTLFPGVYREGQRQQQIQAFKDQGFSDPESELAVDRPDVFGELWKQRMFWSQFQAAKQQFPNMSDAELYTRMQTPGGMENLFVAKPVPGFKTTSGAEAPGMLQGNTLTPPPGMNFSPYGNVPQPPPQTTAQPAPPAGPQPQATPGRGGGQGPVLSPMDQMGITYNAAKKGAEDRASAEAKAQPAFPGAKMMADSTISRLEALRDNPNLPLVVGSIAGRTRAIRGPQADLVNEINTLQGKILGDTVTNLRGISGRPVNGGIIKEVSMGLGDLIGGRVGTIEGYKKSINDTINQVKDETIAAWEAQGGERSGVPKPTWGAESTPQLPTPNTTHIQQLKLNPGKRNEFDQKFGNGAAARYLGQ